MNRVNVIGSVTAFLLVLLTTNFVFADEYWDHHDNKGLVHGQSLVIGVQVKTESGFMMPDPAATDDDEILYNIPADGTEPVPLREVPTLYMTNGSDPVVIDESISGSNPMRGLVYPGAPNPITYGDWIDIGHSRLHFKILGNGMTKIKMVVKGLLPNSLYTVWQFNKMPGPPGPFAGIPNVLATNHKGNAVMKRILPYDIREVVATLALIYHSDQRVYGGTPSLVNVFAGHDQHVQLQFDMSEEQ